jgi:hypothetical protein
VELYLHSLNYSMEHSPSSEATSHSASHDDDDDDDDTVSLPPRPVRLLLPKQNAAPSSGGKDGRNMQLNAVLRHGRLCNDQLRGVIDTRRPRNTDRQTDTALRLPGDCPIGHDSHLSHTSLFLSVPYSLSNSSFLTFVFLSFLRYSYPVCFLYHLH